MLINAFSILYMKCCPSHDWSSRIVSSMRYDNQENRSQRDSKLAKDW